MPKGKLWHSDVHFYKIYTTTKIKKAFLFVTFVFESNFINERTLTEKKGHTFRTFLLKSKN